MGKLIIAGSRFIMPSREAIIEALDSVVPFCPTVIATGDEDGVDRAVMSFTLTTSYPLVTFRYHAGSRGRWSRRLLASYGDALLIIRPRRSRCCSVIIREMEELGKPVYIWHMRDDE